jgi:type I restriction enzyme, S subunit
VSNPIVPLSKIVSELENGSRPEGGVDDSGDVFTVGGEHLNDDGGFDFSSVKLISHEFFQQMKRGKVKPNDIIIVKDGATTGKTSFVTDKFPHFPCAINEHVFRLSVRQTVVDPRYVFYYLYSPKGNREILDDFRGATVGGISQDFVNKVFIPLPPLPEQHRIAAFLSRADRLRRLRRVGDSLSASLLQSVFLEMFGNPKTNSKHWQVAKFSDVCESRLGKMLDDKQQTGKYLRLYLRNINVQWANIDLSDVAQMDFNEKDREEFRLKNGDVLICEGGEVGRSAIWRDEMPECYFQKALHRARPNPKLAIPEYIIWLMFMMAQTGGLGDFTSQVTIAHLTGEKLKELVIPVPPLPEQEQFAAVVRRVGALRKRQAESARQAEGLFHSLLSQSFGG